MPGQDERAHAPSKRCCEQHKQQGASKVLTATTPVLDNIMFPVYHTFGYFPWCHSPCHSTCHHRQNAQICLDLISWLLAGSWLPKDCTSGAAALHSIKDVCLPLLSCFFLRLTHALVSFTMPSDLPGFCISCLFVFSHQFYKTCI